MLINASALTDLVCEIFLGAGCSVDEARRVASRLVRANLTGHDSHGVSRVARYLRMIDDGVVIKDQTIRVVTSSDTFAIVDGRFGLGQTVGEQAVRLGVEMAQRSGLSLVGLRHAGHLGRTGDWAEMAADEGLVSIHFMNVRGRAIVAPFGGIDRRFGTDPIAIGVPMGDGPALIHDFATSVVAEGKTNVATQGGPPVPYGSLITGDGDLTDDPTALYGPSRPVTGPEGAGALRAMGDHKGSGLAFMCELLGGAITGSGTVKAEVQRFANGMLSIYIDPERLVDDSDAFVAEVASYVAWVKAARPARGHDEVLVPGEVERRRAVERERSGVELAAGTWDALVQSALSVGVDATRFGTARG